MVIFLVLTKVAAVSSPQTVGSYNQFLTADAKSVDTSQSFGNSSAVWNPIAFTISFPATFVKVTTAQIILSFQAVNIQYAADRSLHVYPETSNVN